MSRKERSMLQRSQSVETHLVRVYLGPVYLQQEWISIDAIKNTHANEIVHSITRKLALGNPDSYELAETFSSGGVVCKERRLEDGENPVRIQLMWPRVPVHVADIYRTEYQFYLRKREADKRTGGWVEYSEPSPIDTFLSAFLQQPPHKEYPDLCNLPDLNEQTLLKNLKQRFNNGNIYTYVGSILISLNPFKFYPIYNPKYVKMYQNRRLGELPPHIFAIADAAYHTMLHKRQDQCIVISGESGSGKTESTNLLLHHLSALSQRSVHGTGVEQTILGAGPVLEAFGNAKTVHNNNSSRFGKFIQVNYKENGMVHGAVVEKYLLEKSRIVSQAKGERNYHVFYCLLAGASEQEKEAFSLTQAEDYFYLNQTDCYTLEDIDGEDVDEAHEFARLRQSMEMVSFPPETQRRIFSVLAAVLHLGNITFKKKADQSHHEAVTIKNIEAVKTISALLKVKESTLIEALTRRKTRAGGETVVMNYKMQDAIATRDAMAKCLYGALFDWIVLQVNHSLLTRRDCKEHQGNSIGVLDIFGFEDFYVNSFEQFCINFANEQLQYYFNQHIFKFEQEEYLREGIQWKNIEFIDNTACLDLFSRKATGILALLDEECHFPGATNDTLLAKFHNQHQNNQYYEVPQMRENSFSVVHYAGKVKYQIMDFREKNSDLMRHDIMLVLKNSSLAFVRELVGNDPVAVLRWAIVRAFFRAYFAFIEAGRRHRMNGGKKFGTTVHEHSQKSRAQQLSLSGDSNDPDSDLSLDIDSDSHDVAPYDLSTYHSAPLDGGSPGSQKSKHHISLHVGEGLGSPDFIGNSRVMRRANRVIMKNRSFKPRVKTAKQLRDLKAMKSLAHKTPLGPRTSSNKGKTKPPSVSAQFNLSLQDLMATLNKANPFFVRCIKSNGNKLPCRFNEQIVLRQLRYTGMLATVRIRQSGYNYRLPFEDFIQQYQILLPKGLVSSRGDIQEFLGNLDLNSDNYQIGLTKVFLRETEKLLLDDALHQAIMKRIICIQRWMKTKVDRKRFVKMRFASIVIQSNVRRYLAERTLDRLKVRFYATIMIQKAFRGFKKRMELKEQHAAAVVIQKHIRGYLHRKRFQEELELEQERRREELLRLEQLKEEQRLEQEHLEEQQRLEERRQEEMRLEKLQLEALEARKREEQRLEEQRLEEQQLEEQRLEEQRLEEQRLEEQRREEQRLEEQRLKEQRLEEHRLEEQWHEEQRLEERRLEEQRLKDLKERRREKRLREDRWLQEQLEERQRVKQQLEEDRLEQSEKQRLEDQRLKEERLKEKHLMEAQQREEQQKEELEELRMEEERLKKKLLETQRLEEERLEEERLEEERLEEERLEEERLEEERLEEQRLIELEEERLEELRLKEEKLKKQRREEQRLEEERLDELRLQELENRLREQQLAERQLEEQRLESRRKELQVLEEQYLKEQQLCREALRTREIENEEFDVVDSKAEVLILEEVTESHRVVKQEEERLRRKQDHLEQHSSASDEGILTKESSVEELVIERDFESVHTQDSEESSGILEDSESEAPSEAPSFDLHSIASSRATPPSTPTSPHPPTEILASRDNADPGRWPSSVKYRDRPISRPPEKFHSTVSYPSLKTQPGPKDLEIKIKPAMTKSASEEFLSVYSGVSVKLRDKRVSAPLARGESLTDSIREEDEFTFTRRLQIEDDQQFHRRRLSTEDGQLLSPGSGPTYKSPFSRAKKHLKNMMGVEQPLSPIEVRGATWKHEQRSFSVSEQGRKYSTLPEQLEGASSMVLFSSKQQKSTKSTKTAFIRNSKKSLKMLLHHDSKKVKKGSEQEDSEDSQTEDAHVPPTLSPGSKQHKYNKKHSPKVKETWMSQSQSQTQESTTTTTSTTTTHKVKHRRKGSKKQHLVKEEKRVEVGVNTWSVSGTSQWQYPTDVLVTSLTELQQFREFLYLKIVVLSKDCGRQDTIFDIVFKSALKEYCEELYTKISVAYHDSKVAFSYKDLMCSYEATLKQRAKRQAADESFPFTMAINAFRGFLDEFNKKKENKELPEVKRKKEKKKKDKDVISDQQGHKYVQTQFSIPTYCELCSSLIWMVEKGYVCQNCKYTVHKKCYPKSTAKCKGFMSAADKSSHSNKRVIGVPLCSLLDDTLQVPILVEKLITAIELDIYNVGIYRKAGAAAKIRELIKDINTCGDLDKIDFTNFHVHVLTSVMKTFFRELPEPLLTFELYDDFIRAAEIKDEKERAQTLFAVIEKLPQINVDVLERLVFHLAKVAQHEASNKMNAVGLSIVFAPSLVRTDRTLPAQESLNHVSRQTTCVQCIINEQLQKIKHTLADIKTLESATATAEERLSVIRASIRSHQQANRQSLVGTAELAPPIIKEIENGRREEIMLSEHIESLQEEKEALTMQLPALELRASSSEEDLLSTDDVDSTADELEDDARLGATAKYVDAPTSANDPPVTPPNSQSHPAKGRAPTPRRRPASKRSASTSSVSEDDDALGDSAPRRASLTTPELTQIGEEIIV